MKTANTATKIVPVVADNTAWTFTATSATLNGHEFPASYSIAAKSGDVYVFATVQDVPVRIHVGKASPVYHACFEAAIAAKSQPKAEAKPTEPAKPVETKAAEPAKQAKPAAKRKAPAKAAKQPAAEKPAEPAKPVETKAAEPAKQARPATKRKAPAKAAKQPEPKAEAKPAPQPKAATPAEECWHGTEVTGKGWRIEFSKVYQRTMVFLDDMSNAKQKAAIEAAGFWWSNTTKSWNKKLTRKAYRAAAALSETLNTLA